MRFRKIASSAALASLCSALILPVAVRADTRDITCDVILDESAKDTWESMDSIRVLLLHDNKPCGDPVSVGSYNDWTCVWTNMPDRGKYSLSVVWSGKYKTEVQGDAEGFDVDVTYNSEETVYPAYIYWYPDEDGAPPKKADLKLIYRDGKKEESASIDAANILPDSGDADVCWHTRLYAPAGAMIRLEGIDENNWYVDECLADGVYTAKIYSRTASRNYTGTIRWFGDEGTGIRPESVELLLLRNGTVIGKTETTEEEGWQYDFSSYPYVMTEEGISSVPVYTISESSPGNHYDTYTDGCGNFSNVFSEEGRSISGIIVWDDNNNILSRRPESVLITLLRNGIPVAQATTDREQKWLYSFGSLPVWDYAAARKYDYAVVEQGVSGYSAAVSGYDITNHYEDAVPKGAAVIADKSAGVQVNRETGKQVDVVVQKIWDDEDNQDGLRPEEITFTLYADGRKVGSETASEADCWAVRFPSLPQLNSNGMDIHYSVSESNTNGYVIKSAKSSVIEGEAAAITFTQTGIHDTSAMDINVRVSWNDSLDADGKRPEYLTVRLYANGRPDGNPVRISGSTDWTYVFKNKARNSGGSPVSYSIVPEDEINGYETEIVRKADDCFSIVNTHNAEKKASDDASEMLTLSGTVRWEDGNNQDGMRPGQTGITLFANNRRIAWNTVSVENGWLYRFENLPKYDDENEISYKVSLDPVEGYSISESEGGFVCTREADPFSIQGEVKWEDGGNAGKTRPSQAVVCLLADGKEAGRQVITEKEGWTFCFDGYPKYRSGREIAYTLEADPAEGYEPDITDGVISYHYTGDTALSDPSYEVKPRVSDEKNHEETDLKQQKKNLILPVVFGVMTFPLVIALFYLVAVRKRKH